MRLVIASAAFVLLAGCATGSEFQTRPVGIGENPNALKRTPCACLEQPQPFGLPGFLNGSSKIQKEAHA